MLDAWAPEIVMAIAAVQLLAVLYFYYRRRNGSTNPDPTTAPVSSDGEDRQSIECGECGAENDPEYRYCRRCVSDLSGESIPGYRSHSPSERSL